MKLPDLISGHQKEEKSVGTSRKLIMVRSRNAVFLFRKLTMQFSYALSAARLNSFVLSIREKV